MNRIRSQGFALPTVVITSVVMFAILVASVGVVSSTRASLDVQFYEGIASDAAESGAVHANSCLSDNNYVSPWGTNSLYPNTTCAGGSPCTNTSNTPSCFVLQDKPDPVNQPTYVDYRSTYTVAPAQNSGNGVQIVAITGVVQLLRPNGQVWDTYTKVLNIRVGAQIASAQIAMGYSLDGAFFATVGKDGSMRAAGYNGYGQLGNNTLTNSLTPTAFAVPTLNPIVAAYTSFLSVGRWMFAVDNQGNAYGAGWNANGQLGVNIPETTTAVSTPAKVQMPAGVGVRAIALSLYTTFFIGTDNNIYAAGDCDAGMLGNNYTVAGCTDKIVPVKVNLPTPDVNNPNTIPTDNIVSDRLNVYIRMQGGAVYGWGDNSFGELNSAAYTTPVSSPVKIGTYGDSGQPGATQIAFDGGALYVLDNSGNVNSIGHNQNGQLGNRESSFRFPGMAGSVCVENTSSDGTTLGINTCTTATNQLFQIRSDGTIYNAAKNVCMNTTNGAALNLAACNTSTNEKFTWVPATNNLKSQLSNKCLDATGSTAKLTACTNSAPQAIWFVNANFTPYNLAANIKKIWTDQYSLSVLTDTGQVWSAGINETGQFGDGTTGYFYPDPVQFGSPVVMTDLYVTNSLTSYENLYTIGNDGRVYGAGSNVFGQLGNGVTSSYSSIPVTMGVIDGTSIRAAKVQSGFGTTVITTTTGNIYTVGNNSNGQLGDGTTNNRSVPIYSKYINPQNAVSY